VIGVRQRPRASVRHILLLDRGHAEKVLTGFEARFDNHGAHQGRGRLTLSDNPDVIPFPMYRIRRRSAVAGLVDEYRSAARPSSEVTGQTP
jgi:hypothetical protein